MSQRVLVQITVYSAYTSAGGELIMDHAILYRESTTIYRGKNIRQAYLDKDITEINSKYKTLTEQRHFPQWCKLLSKLK